MDELLMSLLTPEQQAMAQQRAQQQGLMSLGFGLLGASQGQRGQPRPGIGQLVAAAGPQALQSYQGSFDQTLRDIMLTQQMQDAQAKRKQQTAQQKAIDAYITNLPAAERARFQAFPTQAAEAMFREPKASPGVVGEYQAALADGLITPDVTLPQYVAMKRPPGTTVNVGGGKVGTIPPGFELVQDPRTGALSMRKIPGGPEEQKEKKMQQEQQARADTVIRAGQTLIRDTTTAINTINKSGRGAAGVGSMLSFLPESAAAELQRDIDSIKGNIAIDSLLKIKESGAGLGAIPQAQLEALAGLLGSLDTRMTPNKLKSNLQDIQNLYKDIVEKEGGDPFKLAAQKGWSPETNRDDFFQSPQEAARRELQRRQGGR